MVARAEIAQALGVSVSQVSLDKKRGMPVTSVEAARQWRAENVGPRIKPEHNGGDGSPARGANAQDYWESRARREAAEAELAELKVEEQRGTLVKAADVRAAHAKRLAGLREAMLQIPARLSAVLAAESDQARCHDVLMAEVHTVLQQVAEQRESA